MQKKFFSEEKQTYEKIAKKEFGHRTEALGVNWNTQLSSGYTTSYHKQALGVGD